MIDLSGLSDESLVKVGNLVDTLRQIEANMVDYRKLMPDYSEFEGRCRSLSHRYDSLIATKYPVRYEIVIEGEKIRSGITSLFVAPEPQWIFTAVLDRIAKGLPTLFHVEADDHYHPIHMTFRRECYTVEQIPISDAVSNWTTLVADIRSFCESIASRGCDPFNFADYHDHYEDPL